MVVRKNGVMMKIRILNAKNYGNFFVTKVRHDMQVEIQMLLIILYGV